MIKFFRVRKIERTIVPLVCCLLVIAISCSGCENLRKKFRRTKKKKDQVDNFVPVLTPIDYPAIIDTPADYYKQAYSLWSVWYGDMSGILLAEESTGKEEKFAINSLISQLERMAGLLNEEKAAGLKTIIAGFQEISAELDNAPQIRSKSRMKSQMRRLGSEVRKNYKLEFVEKDLKAAE